MPIHFSIGFVVESHPRRQFETVCATAYIEEYVDARICAVENVSVVWLRDYRECK